MSMLKLSAVAIAAMGVFSGAQAASYDAAAGSSALRTTTLAQFAATCGASTPQVFQAVAAEGGSNIRAVRCGATGNVLSLDTDGGSYRAIAADLAAGVLDTGAGTLKDFQDQLIALNAGDASVKPVRYLDLALCPVTTGTLAAPAACNAGAAKPVQPLSVSNTAGVPHLVSIGVSDVAPGAFDGLTGVDLGEAINLPVGFTHNFKGKGAAATPAIGIVFGVAASRTLYEALMNDQGLTAANAPLCWNAGAADMTKEDCAPVISKDQYRSIAAFNGGQLNTSFDNLFHTAGAALPIVLERRDQGSGTQATSNAYFTGVACTPYYLTPAAAGDYATVNTNNATGDVLTNLKKAGVARIGVVSRENNPANGAGTAADAGWGFLKLGSEKGGLYDALTLQGGTANRTTVQGRYPNQNNAVRGLYDFWSVAYVHVHANPAPDAAIVALANGLEGNFTVTDGTFRLPALTTGTRGIGNANVSTGTYYSKDGMSGLCVGSMAN